MNDKTNLGETVCDKSGRDFGEREREDKSSMGNIMESMCSRKNVFSSPFKSMHTRVDSDDPYFSRTKRGLSLLRFMCMIFFAQCPTLVYLVALFICPVYVVARKRKHEGLFYCAISKGRNREEERSQL